MKKKTIIESILDAVTFLTIILTFLFAVVGIAFNIIYIKTPVKGYSMSPTLNKTVPNEDIDGDVVFINRFANVKLNNIAVANVSWWTKGPIIKRVVATPGDVFQIKDETNKFTLYVNGKELYSKEKTTISEHGIPGGTVAYYNLYLDFISNPENSNNVININGENYILMLENQYMLLGDNWSESEDCLQHGPVTKADIVGKVDIIVEYGGSPTWAMIKEMIKLAFVPNWIIEK